MPFLLNIMMWGVAVYSLKIALSGRPIVSLLIATPRPLLDQVALALDPDGSDREWDDEVNRFLTKLARFSVFSLGIMSLEYCLCIYFLKVSLHDPFAWFLVTKNLLFLLLSLHFRRNSEESNPIHALLAIPAWALRWERIACFATAVCFIAELLKHNHVL